MMEFSKSEKALVKKIGALAQDSPGYLKARNEFWAGYEKLVKVLHGGNREHLDAMLTSQIDMENAIIVLTARHSKDFSMDGNALAEFNEELEKLIDLRLDRFNLTTAYQDGEAEIVEELAKVKQQLPEDSVVPRDLDDAILSMERICYGAAYRDGMADLMATITLNRLNIAKREDAGFDLA